MSESEIKTMLDSLNIPVAYDHFVKHDATPPFVVFRNNDSYSFMADDMTYKRMNQYIIDLVTTDKNITLENSLEDLLDSNHLAYDKNEDYIDSERIYQIRYFI